jgi:hypothetical protein
MGEPYEFESPPMSTVPTEQTAPNVLQTNLRELGLRAGLALQVRRLVEGSQKKEAQLLGVIESRGVMVGPQGPEGEATELATGDVCIVRGFTGQHEFSFISKVLQTYTQPFVYALLAYPANVDARLVRRTMRTRTHWPIDVEAEGQAQSGELCDISMQGAMVSTPQAITAVGRTLRLTIHAEFEGQATELVVQAKACHSHRAQDGSTHFTGMAFTGLNQQDKLVLNYLTNTPRT